ncbi:WXG100 family type VII secretion target [Luedemannella helvata]|uniref:ESAT-6-like protein n=1 Tax=Luedemannella helvata TaxID=349315 RepID=A0ABN2JWL2_9ACTN
MAQGDLVVNFAALHAAAQDIGSTVSNMNSELDGLKQSLQPIVSTWDGDAKTAFAAKQAQWDSAASDINLLLTQIQTAVTRSAETMEARERANMQRFE